MTILCSMAADGVGLITINRPDRLNCVDVETDAALRAAWAWAERTREVRCIVLTGAGDRAFCTGADIAEYLPELRRRGAENADDGTFGGLTRSWPTGKPVIAAINGLALGGGLELALACDIRLASAAARFALPEVRWGIIAGGGGVTRLPRLISPSMAAEMLLTGEPVDAEAALRHGLVNAVFADRDSLMRGALERAVIAAGAGTVHEHHLPDELRRTGQRLTSDAGLTLEELEKRHIVRMLELTDGHLGRTAQLLGIHRNTLRRKLVAFGIDAE